MSEGGRADALEPGANLGLGRVDRRRLRVGEAVVVGGGAGELLNDVAEVVFVDVVHRRLMLLMLLLLLLLLRLLRKRNRRRRRRCWIFKVGFFKEGVVV